MLPSEWLSTLQYDAIYRETKICEMSEVGIDYDVESGVLSCRITTGTYSPFGRLASVQRMTPREAVMEATKLGMQFSGNDDGVHLVFGYQIITAVWHLLHDIRDEGPPSRLLRNPVDKAKVDLNALRRYGY